MHRTHSVQIGNVAMPVDDKPGPEAIHVPLVLLSCLLPAAAEPVWSGQQATSETKSDMAMQSPRSPLLIVLTPSRGVTRYDAIAHARIRAACQPHSLATPVKLVISKRGLAVNPVDDSAPHRDGHLRLGEHSTLRVIPGSKKLLMVPPHYMQS